MMPTLKSINAPGAPLSFPVTLWWSEYKPNLKIPSLRGANLALHVEFHRYALSVAKMTNEDIQAFNSTMQPLAYALLDFEKYLSTNKLSWEDVDNEILEAFRDVALKSTQGNTASRCEATAKVTTNVKLRIIYEFFAWTHLEGLCRQPIIGWGKEFPIKSSLTLFSEKQTKWNERAARRFPLCYRGIGENSSSVGAQYWATNADLNDIEDFFHLSQPAKTAARNVLFMRTADQTGFRRASINSLVVSQFTDKEIEKSIASGLKAHSIQPKKQKLGRNFYFDIPYALAWEINRYLRTLYGDDVVKTASTDDRLKNLPVFTSMITGKRMTDKTWSSIFTEAFQAIGAPVGSGLHSIRRKFAEEWFRAEIHELRKASKPTDLKSVSAGLARVLGHNSKLSQEAYRRASATIRGATPVEVLTEQNSEQAAKIMNLTAQLEEQRLMLEKFHRLGTSRRKI